MEHAIFAPQDSIALTNVDSLGKFNFRDGSQTILFDDVCGKF